MNYAEHILKLAEHQRSLTEALRHNKLDAVPTLLKAMRMRLDRIEEYVQTHA